MERYYVKMLKSICQWNFKEQVKQKEQFKHRLFTFGEVSASMTFWEHIVSYFMWCYDFTAGRLPY